MSNMTDLPDENKESKENLKPNVMGFTVGRVNGLSDGVFAVAITLLVLSIAVPQIRGTVTESKLAHGIAELWPHFFAYTLSFIIIGMFWISHHALFTAIRRVDRVLIWMNMFYLLMIVFMPYPTNLLALYGETMVATIMYAAVLAAAGIIQALMGFYAMRGHRLVDDEFDLAYAGDFLRGSLIMAAVFLISIGIAFASPSAAKYFWLVLFITPLFERAIFKKKPLRPGATRHEKA